jgi:hypothetical protein
MTQPLLGILSTLLVIVVSFGFLALWDLPTFLGWVSLVMLCVVPPQIVAAVIATRPPFAPDAQPARGTVLLAVNVLAAAVLAVMVWQVVGEGVSPPGPIPSQFAVIVVPTTFFLCLAFGGWPFTRLSRNMGIAGAMILIASYVLTYVVFRVFFDYEFLQGAPVHLASAPNGAFNAVSALVFYVTMLGGMFVMLHFDLWPLNRVQQLARQPALGFAWTAIAAAISAVVMVVATRMLSPDPMYVLTRVTAPFIFGTIIVLNMMENSIFKGLRQPSQGLANLVAATVIGVALAQLYGTADRMLVGIDLPTGAPGYEFELWLVNALLSVTFPLLIVHAVYFGFWPMRRRSVEHAKRASAAASIQ